jgi:hypothetical protein
LFIHFYTAISSNPRKKNMKTLPIITSGLVASTLLISLTLNTANADSDDKHHDKTRVIKAEIATGPNMYLDRPIRDHGIVQGIPMGTLGFAELGEYNPGANEALPLTSETSDDAVLATFLDPNFIRAIGFDPNDLNPEVLNVPLQKVATLSQRLGPNGMPIVERTELPAMEQSFPYQPSIAGPNKEITLGDWKKARGKAIIKCNDDSSSIELRMKHLIPNRVYTVWSANAGSQIGPFNQPLAGAPSAVTSDEKGNARFKRELNFCPLEAVAEAQAQMMWIMVVLHTDHMAYGGVFAPNTDSLFGGTVAHVHLHFPLLGTPVE